MELARWVPLPDGAQPSPQRRTPSRRAFCAAPVFAQLPPQTTDQPWGAQEKMHGEHFGGTAPAGQREAFILVDWLELEPGEAGQMLKLSPNAVPGTALSRAERPP